jgi:hypothetical protein
LRNFCPAAGYGRLSRYHKAVEFYEQVLAIRRKRKDRRGEAKGKMVKQPFGKTPDGQSVELYTLTNERGMEARIMTYGGIIVSLKTPDRQGKFGGVVLAAAFLLNIIFW